MAFTLVFAAVFCGMFACVTGEDFILPSCRGNISTTADIVVRYSYNEWLTESCEILLRAKDTNQFLQASFGDFVPKENSYQSSIQVYNGEKKEEYTKIPLDTEDASAAHTIIFSRGPALFVSILKDAVGNFRLNVSAFDRKYVEKYSSQYFGNATSPRFRRGQKNVAIKNLRYVYTIKPMFASTLSLAFPELSVEKDCIRLLPLNQSICTGNKTKKYEINSPVTEVVLDVGRRRDPRGEGFTMTFEVCGGSSEEMKANVTLPTRTFYGFNDELRCSYIYRCQNGYIPVLTITTEMQSNQDNVSSIEIYQGEGNLTKIVSFSLQNISESFVGNGTDIAIILNYKPNSTLSQSVVSANFSFREKGCSEQYVGNEGEFSSVTFKGKYPNFYSCIYTISTKPKTYISLTVTKLLLAQNDCNDFLEIREKGRKITRKCNSTIEYFEYMSAANEIQIYFETDGMGTAEGFTVRWKEQEIILPFNLGVIAMLSVFASSFVVCVPLAVYCLMLSKRKLRPNKADGVNISNSTDHQQPQHRVQNDQVYDSPWEERVTVKFQSFDMEYAEVMDCERNSKQEAVVPDKSE